MLQSLIVKNFAIIDNIQIDFNPGMTVLTGQTGAGKSLIIDAIDLLFGGKSSPNQIRHGEAKAFIEGIFINYSEKVKEILEENDIEDDDFLTIKKEIYAQGKSICKVNGQTISLSVLNEISFELGDIHSQFETIKLINPKNYFDFIDNDKELLKSYRDSYKEYKRANTSYLDSLNNEELKKLDYLKFQYNEFEKAELSIAEENELLEQMKIIQNYEKIANNYKEFLDTLENASFLDKLNDAAESLKKNAIFDNSIENKLKIIDDCYYGLADVYQEVKKTYRNLDYDYDQSDKINERLSVYSSLKRKYKMTTEELIAYQIKLENNIKIIENHDFYLAELKKKTEELYKKTEIIGQSLSNKRKENAIVLISEMKKALEELTLKNVNFDISFTQDNEYFKPNGIDVIDFLVSFNIGEPLKPLSKIASGGELSRFILALKSISYKKLHSKTFIFDEIDSYVSGEVAYSIATKMKNIAKSHQVLCVTHLPQVASIATTHVNITKSIVNSKTISEVTILNFDQRADEIAKMISNGNITEASKTLAYELLTKNSKEI